VGTTNFSLSPDGRGQGEGELAPRFNLRKVNAHLRAGGVIAYATAASFGLGCDPFNARAVRRVFRVKRRPASKGLIVIADRFARLERFATPLAPRDIVKLHEKWPGPHTWVLPAARRVPKVLCGRFQTVALRVDAHADAVSLCRALRMPLVSTSANIAGRRALRSYRACLRQFGNSVLVIPGRVRGAKRPSTIQDFNTGRIFR
jgi:L-threonylcarbamoyladenylate synthase